MDEVISASYDQFGHTWSFCGRDTQVMRDEAFRYDDNSLEPFKIMTSSVTLVDGDISCRTPIDQNGRQRKIVSWQYHGNDEEEIMMAVEHGRI